MSQFTHEVREMPMVKAFFLTIVTLGIYYAILLYRNTHDIQENLDEGHKMWRLWFWLGFVTLSLTWIVLYIFNAVNMQQLRATAGLPESPNGWIALGLHAGGYITGLLGVISPFIWASYSNELANA